MADRKEIPNCDGRYTINEAGEVRNSTRILKTYLHGRGYYALRLKMNDKSGIHFIHRLLASVFVPNPLAKSFVNHKNGIKTDNRIENLEWVTSSENNKHAYETGLKIPYSKVSKDDRNVIRNLSCCGLTQQEIADRYNLQQSTVSQIINFRKVYANG
jgi:hypothetical protein